MRQVIAYLLIVTAAILVGLLADSLWTMPAWYGWSIQLFRCAFIGGIGGVLYCLRAVYLNKCVRKTWDDDWRVWYYLRPITSTMAGAISFIFLKAGLLVLDAKTESGTSGMWGFLALAFIAGYNVDNFMKKLEAVAQTIWGVSPSRSSEVPVSRGAS